MENIEKVMLKKDKSKVYKVLIDKVLYKTNKGLFRMGQKPYLIKELECIR